MGGTGKLLIMPGIPHHDSFIPHNNSDVWVVSLPLYA